MKTFQDFLKEVKKSAASRLLRIMKDKELIKNPPRMKRTEEPKEKNKHVNDVFLGQGSTKTCPSCGSANIKQYSASDMQCNSCHAAWEPKKEVNKAIDKSHKKQGVAEETSDKSYTICKRCGGRGKVWKSTRDPKTVLPGNNQDKDTKRYTCGACKGVGIIKEEFVAEEKHRVQVTISDPNHVAVSKRKEQAQKHIRVSAEDKDSAVEKAKAYYNKAGYKVHSAEHVGMIKEESSACEKPVKEQAELIDELSRDLTQYRKKAALITSAADQAKKYDIGHSKFKGILKSTFKKIQKC